MGLFNELVIILKASDICRKMLRYYDSTYGYEENGTNHDNYTCFTIHRLR
jgi:hypothetical protein